MISSSFGGFRGEEEELERSKRSGVGLTRRNSLVLSFFSDTLPRRSSASNTFVTSVEFHHSFVSLVALLFRALNTDASPPFLSSFLFRRTRRSSSPSINSLRSFASSSRFVVVLFSYFCALRSVLSVSLPVLIFGPFQLV